MGISCGYLKGPITATQDQRPENLCMMHDMLLVRAWTLPESFRGHLCILHNMSQDPTTLSVKPMFHFIMASSFKLIVTGSRENFKHAPEGRHSSGEILSLQIALVSYFHKLFHDFYSQINSEHNALVKIQLQLALVGDGDRLTK